MMDNKTKFESSQWLFFDIGSTLVDEEAAYNHRITDMIAGTELTFKEVCEKRVEYAQQGPLLS